MTLPLWTMASSFLRARWRFRHLRGSALKAYQDRLARRIVAYAVRRAPFYHDLYQGCDLRNWRGLPVIQKHDMMTHFDTFNTHGIRLEEAMSVALRAETSRDFCPRVHDLTVGLSSGTSGHRGLFLVSPWEQAAWAGAILARTMPRLRRRGYRVAFFLRSNSNLYEQVGGRWMQFRYFDLMTPLPEAVAALNEFQPDFLIGPPSLLGFLAEARRSGQLRGNPERLISVAEVLEPQDREAIGSAFDQPVHQIYQCTEGLLAASCPAGPLHVQEDVVALQFEPLPAEDGTPRMVPIITDLWRRTQPIIRYRLNDVVALSPFPCPCGSAFRVISRIEGRCDDLCYFDLCQGGRRPFFPDTVRRMILLSSPDIVNYQAFQEHCGHLRIHLELTPAGEFDRVVQAVTGSVARTVAQYGCRQPTLVIERGLVPQAADRKRRRVQRLG
jgi:phenylacetate-CoA ligase